MYKVSELDPFVVTWMRGISGKDYWNFLENQKKPDVFNNITFQGLIHPAEMSRAIRLQEYIDEENPDGVTTTGVMFPNPYDEHARGFKIGHVQTSDDVINFAKNTLPEDWKFEVPKSIPVNST